MTAVSFRFLTPLALLAGGLLASTQQSSPPTFEELKSQAVAVLDTDPSRAITFLQQAIVLQPSWAEGWFYLGGAFYRLKRFDESVAAFHKGTKLDPSIGPAWAFQGMAEHEIKQDDKALADIRHGESIGIHNDPHFEAAARLVAANILIKRSLFDQALWQVMALSKYPDMPQAAKDAAGLIALTIPKDFDELSPERQKVVRLAGEAQWASVGQRSDESVAAYNRLLTEYPNEPGVHYAHGLFLLSIKPHEAVEEFQNELKLNPTHWPSMLVMAFLESRNGDTENALAHVEKARKYAPRNYGWLCDAEAGRAYETAGETEKAIASFENAVKGSPDNAELHHFLEQNYKRAGRKADAQRESAIFLKLKAAEDPHGVPNAAGSADKPLSN
jgi:tetratricopeptide (TPR) repeat protein